MLHTPSDAAIDTSVLTAIDRSIYSECDETAVRRSKGRQNRREEEVQV